MAAHTIRFIEAPRFEVDFRQFRREAPVPLSYEQRIRNAVASPFQLIKIIFTALGKATSSTFGYSWSSFKYTVLGYYGNLSKWRPPSDIYLIGFKLILWVVGMGWCFVSTTFRVMYAQVRSPTADQDLVARFAGNEIDVTHLVTNELGIDMSGVSAEVKVDQLLAMFDQINFDRPGEPGYMALGSRQGYSAAALKKSLEKFIDHVKKRTAFLGTPPSYDVARLFAFYQQIENAVRFSIHKVESDLAEFRKTHGEDPNAYGAAQQREHKNLLENRARVSLNLAIAGNHCGARYMGEAMELYNASNQAKSSSEGTLRDNLIELLAVKRREIAEREVAIHFQGSQSTHGYSNYMATLGPLLGIPGTKGVIEHLSSPLDRSKYLRQFFISYTVDCILNTVREKWKASVAFQGKVMEWLRSQVDEWQNGVAGEDAALVGRIRSILAEQQVSNDFSLRVKFLQLQRFLTHLGRQAGVPHEEFVNELFRLDAAREWLVAEESDAMKRGSLKNDLQLLFDKEQLGDRLLQKVRQAISGGSPLSYEEFVEDLLVLQKVMKSRGQMPIPRETLIRVIRGELALEEAVRNIRNKEREPQFLSALKIEEMARSGQMTEEMLEWILVANGILLAQGR